MTMKMKWYETTARYIVGIIFLIGAIDGALILFFDYHLHGRPHESYVFLLALQQTTYFWALLKLIQLLGALSLLTNYKPVMGVAILIPVTSVMFLFYIFESPELLPFGLIIAVSEIILCRAYSASFVRLFDDYSTKSKAVRVEPKANASMSS